jgi:hypothetical protein
VRAIHVHVVHELLVVGRVEDEGEVDQGIGAGALQDGPHGVAVAHVHALELRLGPVCRGRSEVADDDPLGLLAAGQQVHEPRADVPGPAGDQVAHGGGD